MPATPGRMIVIGIGNPDRGDDAVGREVARKLRAVALPDGLEIAETEGETTALIALLEKADSAVLIDACLSSRPPGTIDRFDVRAAPLPQTASSVSTHGLGLREALELARILGQLPARCVVYAIEARSLEAGERLSPEVAAAADEAVQRILGELAEAGGRVHA